MIEIAVMDAECIEVVGDMVDLATRLTWRHLADRTELSATASDLLHRLAQDGPGRMTSIASAAGVSQSAMTQLVQRLEQDDLVARLRDSRDGRATLVSITTAGRAALRLLANDRRDRLSRLLTGLSAQDTAALQLAAHVAIPIIRHLCAGDHVESVPTDSVA